MLNTIEIAALINSAVLAQKNTKRGAKPSYNLVYEECCKHSEEVLVHSDGKFPEKLFKNRAPGENPIQWTYRKENYEPITKSPWQRAMNTINRIWNSSNYNIEWDKDQKDEKEYFFEKYPTYKSILAYYREIFTPFKIKDPNAVRAIKPLSIPVKQLEDGTYVLDQSEQIEPIAVIYGSEQVIAFSEKKYAFIMLKEKAVLDYGGVRRKDGTIFELYDDQNIYRITQIKTDVPIQNPVSAFDIVIYFPHQLGHLPVKKLKGIPHQIETETMYKSYFDAALPNLNLAIHDASTLQISKTTHVFPQKWMFAPKCKPCKGNGYEMIDGKKTICEACKGAGKIIPSHTQDLLLLETNSVLDDKAQIPTPPAGYTEQNTEILSFSRSEITEQIKQAFLFVNIDISNSQINAGASDETATRSRINREELFSFLLNISHECWEDLSDFIEDAGKMKFMDNFKKPEITDPVDFTIRSLEEIGVELADARASSQSNIVIANLVKEYINIRFNTRKDIDRIVDLISKVERVLWANNLEIASMISTRRISTPDAILHDSIFNILEIILAEDPNFLDKKFEEQKKVIDESVAQIMSKLQQPIGSSDNLIAQSRGIATT